MTFEAHEEAARQRVSTMDQIDGFKDRGIQTIVFALEAGLRQPNNEAAFDALVMLKDVMSNLEQQKARV